MWKQKIGIAVGNKLRSPDEMKMLADIGFDSVSPGWAKDGDVASNAEKWYNFFPKSKNHARNML